MSRSWAPLAALLLATGVSCAANSGGETGTAGTGTAGGGTAGSGGGAGGAAGAAGTSGGSTATAGTGGVAGARAARRARARPRAAAGRRERADPARAAAAARVAAAVPAARRAGAAKVEQPERPARRAAREAPASRAGTGGGSTGGIPVPAGYRLVWSDEFDVDGRPNTANWKYEQGFVRNEEDQWYQPDNARVEGGLLIIEARREQKANPNYQAGQHRLEANRQYAEYTSSSLQHQRPPQLAVRPLRDARPHRHERRHVARVVDAGQQRRMAVERRGRHHGILQRPRARATSRCGTSTRYQAKWDSVTKTITSFNDPQWSSKFHVWRMDWDDTKIDLYLDDALMNTTNLADMLNPNGKSPFRQPHYMLVNLALGGINGGDPSGSTFPARYEVDYVRVFQKQ